MQFLFGFTSNDPHLLTFIKNAFEPPPDINQTRRRKRDVFLTLNNFRFCAAPRANPVNYLTPVEILEALNFDDFDLNSLSEEDNNYQMDHNLRDDNNVNDD
ncbi:hypothetical protein AVEN_204918-1 [Araneus ventricosus]|uniref:Uncharacterized protein n=1 Tax=Araneus ventricosus TaxID=182803 RepID=A0A4Y2SLS0_ARAVE|nr:hypothetical protein AVEN_108474-1 [Araneus ventricosus]GBN88280.1 hypothetical protein AVEN_204918-1 [Araneus ventricosus]